MVSKGYTMIVSTYLYLSVEKNLKSDNQVRSYRLRKLLVKVMARKPKSYITLTT